MPPDLLILLAPIHDALWRCMVTHVCQLYNEAKRSVQLVVYRGAEVTRVKVKFVNGGLRCTHRSRVTPLVKCVLACLEPERPHRHGCWKQVLPAPVQSAATRPDSTVLSGLCQTLLVRRRFHNVQHLFLDLLATKPYAPNSVHLLCQLLHPFHWVSNSTIVRASQLVHVLPCAPSMWWVKQFIQDWAAVAQDFVCPACALRGIRAVKTCGRVVKPKGQTAFLSAQCNACPARSVVCVSTARVPTPGSTEEWWMTSPSRLTWKRRSCSLRWTKTWPRVALPVPSQSSPAQLCC